MWSGTFVRQRLQNFKLWFAEWEARVSMRELLRISEGIRL
jgi:hypothetical protein